MIYEPAMFKWALETVSSHWRECDKALLAALSVLAQTWAAYFNRQIVVADLYAAIVETKMDWPRFIHLAPDASNPGVAAHFALDRLSSELRAAGKPEYYEYGDERYARRYQALSARLLDLSR